MPLPPPAASSTCLVTGASSGIGADLARELARRGYGVTLVARREARLRDLAREIAKAHRVRAEVIRCDIAKPSARKRLATSIAQRDLTVELLVNNAGFGSAGRFHQLDAEREVELVRTNVEAVIALCGFYVPAMVERGRGAVLNLGSTAAFQPLPRQATYAASKAFVVSFSEALSADLHGTGVTVSALCPGPVRTEFTEAAGIGSQWSGAFSMSSADVARAGVRALESGRRVVTPGPFNTVSALGGRHIPRGLLLSIARRVYLRGRTGARSQR